MTRAWPLPDGIAKWGTGLRFDDRLKTVLDSPVGDARDRAVRWRQLVDLLSRARGDSDPALFERAIAVAREDRGHVPPGVRAATARSIAGRPLDPRLIALFASDRLEVAAPLLAGATLDPAARAEVEANASEEVRRFVFALEGPPVDNTLDLVDEVEAEPAQAMPSIGEVVARIERLREKRQAPTDASEAEKPAEPASEVVAAPPAIALFRWESDALGSISWVDGAPRAALIGRAMAGHSGEALLDERCRELIARRAPFADMPLASAEPFAGDWRVSGAPAFAPGDGRFIGYRGIARRIDLSPEQRAAVSRPFEGTESLREMVHEIKTPLNAIIGFAEIIDGQYLGPAHRRYRERASDILDQARKLLSAIEDLDFAARLQSGRADPGEGTDFAGIFPRVAEAMNAHGTPRRVSLTYSIRGKSICCGLASDLAERLVRRFLEALMDASAPGESVAVAIAQVQEMCGVMVARPSTLRETSAEQLFDPSYPGPNGGAAVGLGFAFRLVRGLVRMAGGDLIVDAERFTLLVPGERR
jgi:signal transduction histidine kinase